MRKCCGTQLLFHQQYYTQLYQDTKQEVTPNIYVVRRSMPCASKISANLLVQKLLIEL